MTARETSSRSVNKKGENVWKRVENEEFAVERFQVKAIQRKPELWC